MNTYGQYWWYRVSEQVPNHTILALICKFCRCRCLASFIWFAAFRLEQWSANWVYEYGIIVWEHRDCKQKRNVHLIWDDTRSSNRTSATMTARQTRDVYCTVAVHQSRSCHNIRSAMSITCNSIYILASPLPLQQCQYYHISANALNRFRQAVLYPIGRGKLVSIDHCSGRSRVAW